jgi:hypothetical protein
VAHPPPGGDRSPLERRDPGEVHRECNGSATGVQRECNAPRFLSAPGQQIHSSPRATGEYNTEAAGHKNPENGF